MKRPMAPTQTVLLALGAVCLAGGGAAHAGPQAAGQSTSALYACAANTDGAARLACFDAEVARLKAAETGGEVAVVSREEVRQAEREVFGLAGADSPALAAVKPKVAAAETELREVTLDFVTIEKKLDGKLRLVTADGQVWVQTDATDARVRGKGPWKAEIKEGLMGSYFLKVEGGRAIKARREK